METPPSSPLSSSQKPSGASNAANYGPPALTDTISQSLSRSPESTAREPTETGEGRPGRSECGHRRSTIPLTPVPFEAYAMAHSGPGAPRQFSTPGRDGFTPGRESRSGFGWSERGDSFGGNEFSGGKAHRVSGGDFIPGVSGGFQGAPISDLTPIISNSGTYSDAHLSLSKTKPGMPGLPSNLATNPKDVVQEGGESRSSSSSGSAADGLSSTARGLRQRRLPLLRAGQPPAKRSSVEGGPHKGAVAAPFSPPTPLSAIGASLSRGTSEDSYENLGNLLGERLSMPSYSEDGSSVDTSGSGQGAVTMKNTGTMTLGGASSIFKNQNTISLATPIELEPDRKFLSFQDASQYKQLVATKGGGKSEEATPPRQRAVLSPSRRPPASPKKERQYRPMLRSQHGVKEMADAHDLDAIFKAPRKAPAKVVTPFVSPVHLHRQQPPLSPSRAKEEELAQPYPVESQWSIPSIRLANHVNQTSSSERPDDSFASYADCSDYTGDESFYSFLEDDDASLSSRGSLDASARRRRRISGIFQLQRKASEGAGRGGSVPRTIPSWDATEELADAIARQGSINSQPGFAPTNSFPETMRGISIENAAAGEAPVVALPPALARRADTFDSEAPPPILDIAAAVATADDAADEYSGPRRHRRSGRCRKDGGRGSGRRRREGEAAEWLRGLKDRSSRDASLAEAASSRFLGAGGGGSGGIQVGGGRPVVRPAPEDAARVLGMPHPLCRSSTIEAGTFVR